MSKIISLRNNDQEEITENRAPLYLGAEKYNQKVMADIYSYYHPETIYSTRSNRFIRYENGIWETIEDDKIATEIVTFCRENGIEKVTDRKVKGTIKLMKRYEELQYSGEFNSNKYLLNLKNGIYNLKTGEFREHRPEDYSTIQLNTEYLPDADCPLFEKTLAQILPDKEVRGYFLKIALYLLIPSYDFQKIWILYGTGRNGKGTLVNVIQNLLGPENSTNIDIMQLSNGKFMMSQLKDKYVNFSSESRFGYLHLEQLKKLSGGDYITTDVKYNDPINFKNFARLIISLNEFPRITEVNDAIIERFEVIHFPNKFTNKDVNTGLVDQLSDELPGILNLLISKSEYIFDDNGNIFFESPVKVKKATKSAFNEMSNVGEFIEEEVDINSSFASRANFVYQKYRDNCKRNGYRYVGRNQFYKAVESLFDVEVKRLPRLQNKHFICGLKLYDHNRESGNQILLKPSEMFSDSADNDNIFAVEEDDADTEGRSDLPFSDKNEEGIFSFVEE